MSGVKHVIYNLYIYRMKEMPKPPRSICVRMTATRVIVNQTRAISLETSEKLTTDHEADR